MKTLHRFFSIATALIVITLFAACNSKSSRLTARRCRKPTAIISGNVGQRRDECCLPGHVRFGRGVILRANHMPIVGFDSIRATLLAESDTQALLPSPGNLCLKNGGFGRAGLHLWHLPTEGQSLRFIGWVWENMPPDSDKTGRWYMESHTRYR